MRLAITLVVLYAVSAGAVDWLPATCKAHRTVGMHQYPGDVEEIYKPAVFSRQTFELRENVFLMRHLPGAKGDNDRDEVGEIAGSTRLYVTMRSGDGNEMEFECRPVRGTGENRGYSCVNNPPSEMLLINPARARFTRSAIGGWTFYTPEASLFVEYGTCVEQPSPESASDRRR
ncbi:MAG: hypothetical protein OXP28_10460 [Gammaproteobacteria bacterium]|nr:hypothetical protein [Gammaproteobacteria bacterium]